MKKNRKLYIFLGILQLIIAIGAIPAGLAFTIDPTGHSNGGNTEILSNSPFNDFLIPGLFLLIIHGVGNLFGAFLSFWRFNLAGITGIALGVTQVLWIVFQVVWIGLSSFLQPTFFIVGFAEALIGYAIYRRIKKQNELKRIY